MSVWTTSESVFEDTVSDTIRSKSYSVPVDCSGLKPSTKFSFYLDGIDLSWAAKPWGGRLGSDLVSDADGKLYFEFLFDFQYNGNYSFDEQNAAPKSGDQYRKDGSIAAQTPYYYKTQKFLELKGVGGAYASTYLPLRLLVTPQTASQASAEI